MKTSTRSGLKRGELEAPASILDALAGGQVAVDDDAVRTG
jgi:hypothetical protein